MTGQLSVAVLLTAVGLYSSSPVRLSSQLPGMPPKRLRMLFAFGASAPQSSFVSMLKQNPGVINVASAYCYTLRYMTENTTLPDYNYCANFTEAMLKLQPAVHVQPIIQMGGSYAVANFDKADVFAKLFVPEAKKRGYDGYFLDVEYKGDRGFNLARKYCQFLTTFGTALNKEGIALTVLTRNIVGHDAPGVYLNRTVGLNYFVAEKTAENAGDVAGDITRITAQYRNKAGELLYPRASVDTQEAVQKIFNAMNQAHAQELAFFCNFRDMGQPWLQAMKQWLA